MTDRGTQDFPDFETMTPADFENYLPEFFGTSSNGRVSSDPKLQKFLSQNPDCAALVRDLEAIAEAAKDMFDPVDETDEPSDQVWHTLQKKLHDESGRPTLEAGDE